MWLLGHGNPLNTGSEGKFDSRSVSGIMRTAAMGKEQSLEYSQGDADDSDWLAIHV